MFRSTPIHKSIAEIMDVEIVPDLQPIYHGFDAILLLSAPTWRTNFQEKLKMNSMRQLEILMFLFISQV